MIMAWHQPGGNADLVYWRTYASWVNTLRPRQMDAISQTTFSNAFFFNENVWIPIKFSLKFVPKGAINNIPAMVQIMAWRRSGDKPLSEPLMVRLLTHICVTRSQWVKDILDWASSVIKGESVSLMGTEEWLVNSRIISSIGINPAFNMQCRFNIRWLEQHGYYSADDISNAFHLNVTSGVKFHWRADRTVRVECHHWLVRLMAWYCKGTKPSHEPMVISS